MPDGFVDHAKVGAHRVEGLIFMGQIRTNNFHDLNHFFHMGISGHGAVILKDTYIAILAINNCSTSTVKVVLQLIEK